MAALALSASAALAYDSRTAADPGYERRSDSMSFQDWVNARQRDGELGNRPSIPSGSGDYMYGTTPPERHLIATDGNPDGHCYVGGACPRCPEAS